ncbi:uncharacterized protein L203_105795 [Cryptococcus depauperatus CBS 7841]|uniref:Sister chromatid cohesion protein DCC1 n=1 Tax=Cryptococcus depauperatus CBS 7841 TaxID=1295531 RepID=A0AAJ8M4E8_9TREE
MNNALPQKQVVMRFPRGSVGEETFQLLELPPEILKQVEANDSVFPLTIKGRPSDDATLHTPNATFQLRTIGISNSLLVCIPLFDGTGSFPGGRETLEIRDVCHEVLECLPVAANLERIGTVLSASAWEGISEGVLGKRKRVGEESKHMKRWTKEQLQSVIQASDEELEEGLRERNVVEVDGKMLLLPPAELKELLTIVLCLLTVHAGASSSAPTEALISSLEEHDVSPSLSAAVLGLFGEVQGDLWIADVERIVKQVGMGLLCKIKKNKRKDEFMAEWREEVGEKWTEHVSLRLLQGEHLLDPPPPSALASSSSQILRYYPFSSLPLNPSRRFAQLFQTRPRWTPEEITPFLRGLTREGDMKGRDKLVAKRRMNLFVVY